MGEETVDLVIVGAGPYGLSLATHLRRRGVSFRIFGRPMASWRDAMPAGMVLKSDGFASNLSDPDDAFTLESWCAQNGVAYRSDRPVSLQTFIDYGLAFQRTLVPELEQTDVLTIGLRQNGTFAVEIETSEIVFARRVVLATGIKPYGVIPPPLDALSQHGVSAASAISDPAVLKGLKVAVIGAGSSAIDLAVLAARSGARAEVIARASAIRFASAPGPAEKSRTLVETLRSPPSGLGPGWKSRLACELPDLYRLGPASVRHAILARHLGPSSPFALKADFEQLVSVRLNTRVEAARAEGGQAILTLVTAEGAVEEAAYDKVIAATGYPPLTDLLEVLAPDLRDRIASTDGMANLKASFETSVPGLYLIGLGAAPSFGPLLRFVFGARFAARRVAACVATG